VFANKDFLETDDIVMTSMNALSLLEKDMVFVTHLQPAQIPKEVMNANVTKVMLEMASSAPIQQIFTGALAAW